MKIKKSNAELEQKLEQIDLLREAYLIPKRFHGKAGKNPELLTTPEGDVIEEKKKLVTKHEFEKFRDVYKNHSCAPRSKLYLADGYDLMRVYTDGMNIKEKRVDKRRGVLILYALPDTVKLGLSEAQTYDVIWNTFHKIQQTAPTAMVYYGQETGEKAGKSFDEIGVLLPVHQFEKKMLMHLSEIDGIVLACREEMMKKAGSDSLDRSPIFLSTSSCKHIRCKLCEENAILKIFKMTQRLNCQLFCYLF